MLREELALVDKKAPKVEMPKGYDSVEDFHKTVRERYDVGYTYNLENMKAGKDDARFVVGYQWDPEVYQERIGSRKPALTFNHLVAYMAQVVGNRLANETDIRVYPEHHGKREIAEIREGLIKSIYKNSHADFARDEAAKYQVIGGEGYFTLAIEYTADDVFEQEVRLNPVSDPYSVVLDPVSIEPSGGDAQWGFVTEEIDRKTFKKRWPKASLEGFEDSEISRFDSSWCNKETVKVAMYWEMVTEGTKRIALYQDGTTKDITALEDYEWMNFVEVREDGTPYIREVPNRFARRWLIGGSSILEGPHDYPLSSIPIYRVPGWEVNDGEKIHRWGLIRFLKDPARMNNVLRSIMTEQAINAPRNKWLTTTAAIQGHEQRWRNAAVSDDPFLIFNDDAAPPQRQEPPPIDQQLSLMSGTLQQDIKDISGIHEASLGMPSNEVSRVAIQQRQAVSDIGTYIYVDRRRIADERCAKNINELIPYLYDTKRTVTVIGKDNKETLQVINDPSQPNNDITLGKYSVKVSTGPASETKRAQTAEQMMAFVNAMPQMAGSVMDLVAKNLDWPGASEFERRFKKMLPPGMLSPEDMSPEEQQAQAQQAQMAQMQAQLAAAMEQAKIAEQQAKAANQQARAVLAEAQAYKAQMDADSRRFDVESRHEDRVQKDEREDEKLFLDVVEQDNKVIAEERDFEQRQIAATQAVVNPNGEPNDYGQ